MNRFGDWVWLDVEADGFLYNMVRAVAGTVLDGSVRHEGSALLFRVRDPTLRVSVPVRYTGIVPDPFAPGRGVLVTVHQQGTQFIGEQNSLTTKCPSKYQAAKASY